MSEQDPFAPEPFTGGPEERAAIDEAIHTRHDVPSVYESQYEASGGQEARDEMVAKWVWMVGVGVVTWGAGWVLWATARYW